MTAALLISLAAVFPVAKFNVLEGSHIVITNNLVQPYYLLAQSGTNVSVSFATNMPNKRVISATNDLNFTGTAYLNGGWKQIKIYSGTTNRNLTFDTNWVWMGLPAPTSIASNKVGILSFDCDGTAATNVIASYVNQL